MFQSFTGTEYLKLDMAGSFGLDRLTWDERLAWFDENQDNLPNLVQQAEEPALFYAGTLAWDKAQKGEPSGYPISLDATCSGIQILAALASCRKTAEVCNVVDTGRREDFYVSSYDTMVAKVGDSAKIERKSLKNACMTAFYGSTAEPKHTFGEGTKLLQAFYETMEEEAPGAWAINEAMLAIWDDTRLVYEWVLPDNFHVRTKVMGKVTEHVHFMNEPFDIDYKINMPIRGGRSLGANGTHSVDGMGVREMQRRCNFDPKQREILSLVYSAGGGGRNFRRSKDKMVQILWNHYEKSGFLSARILDYLDVENAGHCHHVPMLGLLGSLPAKPFEVISIHDCFRCLPNYGNDMRRQYNNLLAEIAESNLLSYIVSQMVGRHMPTNKMDPSLSRDIRESNYALS